MVFRWMENRSGEYNYSYKIWAYVLRGLLNAQHILAIPTSKSLLQVPIFHYTKLKPRKYTPRHNLWTFS